MSQVLLVIDLQNDYFPEGAFPLWHTQEVLDNVIEVMEKAKRQHIPIVHIQHVADATKGMAPFFNEGTPGVQIHDRVWEIASTAPVVKKSYADGFYKTNLGEVLGQLGATELLICGMMTQNCVTHTAISKDAEGYGVKIIGDCCTTVSEAIHKFALGALATRVEIVEHRTLFE